MQSLAPLTAQHGLHLVAQRLIKGLADVRRLPLPLQLPGRGHVWRQFTVLITDESPVDRDGLVPLLTERGVGSGIYYRKLVFDYECYRDNPRVKVAEVPVVTSVTGRVAYRFRCIRHSVPMNSIPS
jgi:perosamine synthetase